jgi:hypothetical protein
MSKVRAEQRAAIKAAVANNDGSRRSFVKAQDYRIAQGLFDSAFSACKRLSPEDQQSLLSKIEKQSSRRIKAAQRKEHKTVRIIGITISESP